MKPMFDFGIVEATNRGQHPVGDGTHTLWEIVVLVNTGPRRLRYFRTVLPLVHADRFGPWHECSGMTFDKEGRVQ
jgi:hypothetical protein